MPSTVIRSCRYDRRRRALEIVFQSRRRYTYLGVPQQTHDA
ncbi:KTSC domain-containing protein, partial [Modestobacter versicolor]